MRLLAAPDKFRGTLDANGVAEAIVTGAHRCGWNTTIRPLSDGGEGFGSVLGGTKVALTVAGPLGEPVTASFSMLTPTTAVLEMASAAGRHLLVAPQGDDPLRASTKGVGELINAAERHGATSITVGCGGSATTDGGQGAVDEILARGDLTGVTLMVATDVTTTFLDAATTFASQKGANPRQVRALRERLSELADHYLERTGIDVTSLSRSGAAGGLAGGLATLGATLCSGFDVLADSVDLRSDVAASDLIVTGEGHLDATTLEGKTVWSLLEFVGPDLPILILCGQVEADVEEFVIKSRPGPTKVLSLSQLFGQDRSRHETTDVISDAVEFALHGDWLTQSSSTMP